MATNTPVTASSEVSPVTVSSRARDSTLSAPWIPVTLVFQRISILGSSNARCCMISDARNRSRRWIRVTLSANLVRNVASSIAESPPPTTAMFCFLKKNPSHVAHHETPWPESRSSSSRPSLRYSEPVEMMTARARSTVPSSTVTVLSSPSSSTETTSS